MLRVLLMTLALLGCAVVAAPAALAGPCEGLTIDHAVDCANCLLGGQPDCFYDPLEEVVPP